MKAKLIAEFSGTAFLVMIVLGSGMMAQNLFQGHAGLALLANSLATGAGLFVLIQCLGHISGAHLNPVVSIVEVLWRRMCPRMASLYVGAQMTGAYLGVILAHIMFDQKMFQVSVIERSGIHLWISELIATFGLICVVGLSGKKHVEFAPVSVALYIMSAYWFTSSTSFANPAVTFARLFTNTFGGMSPEYYLPFILAQLTGGVLAWFVLSKFQKDI
ncbi:MAG: MIP/aquaporin family protein [Bdellovibrionota bacterium]